MTRKKSHSKDHNKAEVPPPALGGSPAGAVSQALDRFKALLSREEYAQLLAELERPLPQALRINPLKINPAEAIQAWAERYHWTLKPVYYEPAGWQVESSPGPISQTIEHRLGFYYIQDAASMLPATLFDLDPARQPLILDMAASPGGKTTHLASRSGDQGLIIANDASLSRLPALRIVLKNWSAYHTAITHYPGEILGDWLPEKFDCVLLDAPCSMQGLRSTESHPMRSITDNEKLGLAQRQGRLLQSAFKAVRPGGQVVYSTCTLTPEEDEAVLDALLAHFPGLAEVEDISRHFPQPVPALTSDGGSRQFDPSVTRAARLWPHRLGTSGFFAALIRKQGSLDLTRPPFDQKAKPAPRTTTALTSSQQAELLSRLSQAYGFDFFQQVEQDGLVLARGPAIHHTVPIYAQPSSFETHFPGLRVQSLGLLFGEETPDGFVLSHEWATRFGQHFNAGRYLIADDQIPAWISGEDLPGLSLPASPETRIVIVTDAPGRNLGRGKIQRDRLRNLLPKNSL